MAITSQTFNGDGATTQFVFSVPYLQSTDVKVSIGGVDTSDFSVSGSNVTLGTAAPTGTGNIEIRRETNNDTVQSNFQSGSALRASDFNLNFTQFQYVTQEAFNVANTALALSREGDAVVGFKSAIDIANEAKLAANAASSVIGDAVPYTPIGTIGALPAAPSDGARVEISDSTGVESFSGLVGVPADFVGSPDLTVRLQYLSSNSAWNWIQYVVIDPDDRYIVRSGTQGVLGQYLASDANGVGVWSNFPVATTSAAGFLSSTDKTKLDGIASGAEVNVQSDWNAVSGDALILNKPTLSAVATSGQYNDLTNAPIVPSQVSQLNNDSGYLNATPGVAVTFGNTVDFNGVVDFNENVNIKGNGTVPGQAVFFCENQSNPHGVTLKAPPHSAGANYTIEFPYNLGTSGQVLSTNGSGGTSWVTPFSGNYNDLTNKPSFASIATTGSYSDLINVPSFASVAFNGSYTSLSNTPALASVATSGSYTDLTNKPTSIANATYATSAGSAGTATSATSATNASYIATSASSTNTNYTVAFLSGTSSNVSVYNDAGLVYNPSQNLLTCSGNITAFSDARLKTNVQRITNAVDKVQAVNGVTFYRSDLDIKQRQTGLIAQELQKVLPEAVIETSDGTLAVAYGNVVGLLVEAIKELKSEIEDLKNATT